MVSDRDRAHFARIARAEAQANQESLERCARRLPGDNIAIGLELSEFAAGFGADLSRPDEVPPIVLWRLRRGLTREGGGR